MPAQFPQFLFAKKSLGQHFLNSKEALRKIIESAQLASSDTVLEIGPGKGVLTEALLTTAGKVIAIEKDDRMIGYLAEKFSREIADGRLTIVHGDALEFDPTSQNLNLRESGYKIVANIPYYITGQIIRRFLSECAQPSRMVLLVQKEVAERIVATAKNGKNSGESILSISVKAYGTPHYIQTVPAKDFTPAPKVDSAIIAIDEISRTFFSDKKEADFFSLIKKGFAHKRKVLVKNLDIPQEKRGMIFAAAGIHANSRAEELSLAQWDALYRALL